MPVRPAEKAMLCYAVMKRREDLADTLSEILTVLGYAMRRFPGKPRILVLDIEGHRNSEGGLDTDAFTLQKLAIYPLGEWFTEIDGPIAHTKPESPSPQREDEISCIVMREDGDDWIIELMQGDYDDYEPRPGERLITAKP